MYPYDQKLAELYEAYLVKVSDYTRTLLEIYEPNNVNETNQEEEKASENLEYENPEQRFTIQVTAPTPRR